MNGVRTVKWVQVGKTIAIGVVLTAIAVAFGSYLGSILMGPNWQDAIRLVGLGGVLCVIVLNPALGLFLWIILEPFTRFWYLSLRLPEGIPDLSLGRLSVALLTLIWVAQLAGQKRRIRRLTMVEIAIGLFCVFSIPSVIASMRSISYASQSLFDKFVCPFLVFILAKNFYDEKVGMERLGGMLSVIGLYLSAMLFYEQITGQPVFYQMGRTTTYTRSLPKIVSLLGNPAFMGTVLAMVVPYALYRFVRERPSPTKTFYGLLFVVTSLASFLCYNRGVWLSLAGAIVVMLVLEPQYRRVLLPVLLIAAVIGILRWQMITDSAVVTERLMNQSGVTFRVTMLTASEKIVSTHPVFGVGLENFSYYFLLYGGHWETLAYDAPTPHNSYLLVLTTMGLAGAIPYVLVFLSMAGGILSMLLRRRKGATVDTALLVTGLAVIAVYTVSAAAVDLFISSFTSLVFFAIAGTIMGYLSSVRAAADKAARAAALVLAEGRGMMREA